MQQTITISLYAATPEGARIYMGRETYATLRGFRRALAQRPFIDESYYTCRLEGPNLDMVNTWRAHEGLGPLGPTWHHSDSV